jgi:membrane protease YdiL (CAAX protease family)
MPKSVLFLIASLILYGNAKSWWDLVVLHTTPAGSLFGVGAGIALVLGILVIAVVRRVDLVTLGLAGGDLRSSLRLGCWVGGIAAGLGSVLILGGGLVARALGVDVASVAPASTVGWAELLWRAVLLLWVDTVLPEELAFRGALLSALSRTRAYVSSSRHPLDKVAREAVRPPVLVSSAAFAAWHVVVVLYEGVADPLTVGGKLCTIAIGGMLFGALRVVGGNLLAPVVGHWLFNVAAMVAARFAISS